MNKNELKELNKVELEEKYKEIIKYLKLLKSKLFIMKSLEGANTGVGIISIVDSIYRMYNYSISKESIFLLALGVFNIASADSNINILNKLKVKIEEAQVNKEDFEREIKVRKFIKNRNNTYQIRHIKYYVL